MASYFLEFLRWPGLVPPVLELQTPLVVLLDLVAVAVCAMTGVLAAQEKKMDLVGLTVIAFVSALGGGTLRDILLGCHPVFWVANPQGVATALVAGWFTFLVSLRMRISARAFVFPDALGLALFTIVGAEKSLALGHGWMVSAIMGVLTGVFGGVLRDLFCREMPSIFQRTELYATASVLGAMVFVLARGNGIPPLAAVTGGATMVIFVRLAAVHWKIKLPTL